MRFTELLNSLEATHPEWDRRMLVIATRYYLDIESIEDLQARTEPNPVFRGHFDPPSLTPEERNDIIRWR